MRYLMYFCVSMFALAGLTGKLAQWVGYTPSADAEKARAATATTTPKPSRSRNDIMVVSGGRNNHFNVDGVIGGRRVNFIVDTGATIVALTSEDATRLGIVPSPRDRVAMMDTANGVVPARRVRLASVEVGPLLVQDVEAVVMPAGRLGQSLLGMSFLSRLRRYEFRSGSLVMEQ